MNLCLLNVPRVQLDTKICLEFTLYFSNNMNPTFPYTMYSA